MTRLDPHDGRHAHAAQHTDDPVGTWESEGGSAGIDMPSADQNRERARSSRVSLENRSASGSTEPLHPHPLANELTRDPLRRRRRAERIREDEGVGAGPRRVLRLVLLIIGVFALLAVCVAAFLFKEHRQILIVGAFVVFTYMIVVASPVLFASATKVAQDEAVR